MSFVKSDENASGSCAVATRGEKSAAPAEPETTDRVALEIKGAELNVCSTVTSRLLYVAWGAILSPLEHSRGAKLRR